MHHITLIQPDDWHCHLRDGDHLSRTVPDTAAQFQRAIVMPNLTPPITTVVMAKNYRERIIKHIPKNRVFTPLMTLYLNHTISPDEILAAKKTGFIAACKLYPAGATTNAQAGVAELKTIYPLLEQMQTVNMPLCIHGESIAPEIDIFDRETVFLKTLKKLLSDFPKLRVILEHISTKTTVDFVLSASNQLAATITPHHLHYNRNDLLRNGIRPHYYCSPILKMRDDQIALIQAATSGHAKFFLGTDSAPHARTQKESACGCAGIYSAHAALAFYAEIFEKNNALACLEKFTSLNGARFYQLPVNQNTVTLIKATCTIPNTLSFGDETLIPMRAGENVSWQIQQ